MLPALLPAYVFSALSPDARVTDQGRTYFQTTAPGTTVAPTKPATTVAPPATTVKSTASSTPSSAGTVARYAQCGGQGWTGATACVSPFTCTVSNGKFSCIHLFERGPDANRCTHSVLLAMPVNPKKFMITTFHLYLLLLTCNFCTFPRKESRV